MAIKTYSPEKIVVTVAGTNIHGYAENSLVTVARSADTFTMVVGADGEVGRSHNPDRSGTITITLKSDSDSNDFLSNLAIVDDLTLTGVFPVQVKDGNGTSLTICDTAWIQKPADSEFAREISEREWIIQCPRLDMYVGGNF